MIRLVAIAILLTSCRISLDDDTEGGGSSNTCKVSTTSQSCLDAVSHSDLAWLEDKVFVASCAFSGCHNGASTDAGRLDLRKGMAYTHLVNFTSNLDPSRKLVVPNNVEASYLMLMLSGVSPEMAAPPGSAPPSDVGYMPQGNDTLCCQKLDAVKRWIMAGAPNN